MTLQQLRYTVTVAEEGTISAAAEKLFVSQPSLTSAVRELEKELGIVIFQRTNRGVVVSREGDEFLGYARQVLLQTHLLEERYSMGQKWEKQFSVSTQHYIFAVHAFSHIVQQYGGDRYEFTFRETATYEIIEDVSRLRSEVGILCLNEHNEDVLQRLFRKKGLKFQELVTLQAHAFFSKDHPLAGRDLVTPADLASYPCITYEQGDHNAFYFSEDALCLEEKPKHIQVRERATALDLLQELNGYTAGTGIFTDAIRGRYVTVPFENAERERIGYLIHSDLSLSPLAKAYIEALKKFSGQANLI